MVLVKLILTHSTVDPTLSVPPGKDKLAWPVLKEPFSIPLESVLLSVTNVKLSTPRMVSV